MKKDVKVLALDFGASSGRAIIGSFDGEKISLKEIHRFTNDPVILLDTMYWDVLRLFHDIKIGLIKAKQEGEIKSLGIDTWGVDFGLLNKDGKLLENHGALTVGSNLVEAYYKMETLELFAKINLNAYLLGGPKEISRENIDKLINLRSYYGVKGRHPGYKHYKED